MAVRRSLVVRMQIDGVRDTLKAFDLLPKNAADALRDASLDLASKLAVKAAADLAAHGGPQGRLVAQTVKARRDRVPVVEAGGTRRLGRHRAPAYGLVFASVFGMTRRSGWYASPRYGGQTGTQYREHRGTNAYAFFPVIEREQREISRAWHAAADRVVREFAEGGDL
ncbi:hypothetical protein ACFORH_42975 [Amycolatopsis roodepoortensis]|uniref:HK97 gp10 family phage protein n=1 Tax=Amycolatopsis roodepoortensis TaxID=700274 RepID=A0ABR9L2S6_9PSEU|nr:MULTISPECIES: hypothetical protein [Amycolatopsis]MBE1575064.1 hypothetical protein [Amycolatopsis roodepoortensis]GHG97568.1 hypothetical protein GCM10017788_77180 [Amycolatopsis acidiphila]